MVFVRPISKHGFSLIELIVVLGVLTLLAVLTVPVVARTMEASRNATCIMNLRNLGQAMYLYVGNRQNAKFPTQGGARNFGVGGIDVDDHEAWFNVLPPLFGEPSLQQRVENNLPLPRAGDGSIWSCPSRTNVRYPTSPNFDESVPWLGYAYNMWIDKSDREEDHNPALPELLTILNIPDLSRFVLLGESRIGWRSFLFANGVSYHHGGDKEETNIAFADGRVGTYARDDIYLSSRQTTFNRGGIIWDPQGTDIDGSL